MRAGKLFAAAVAGLAAGCCCLCGEDYPGAVDEGFVSLFNGRDLSGWTGATEAYGVEPFGVRFENGTETNVPVLVHFPDRRVKGRSGNLVTAREYRNFILRFEFMMPENGDGGLGIRTPDAEVDAACFGMCELRLRDDGGSLYYDASNRVDRLKPCQYAGSAYGVVSSLRDNVDKQIPGKEKDFAGGGSYVRKPGMWNFAEVKVVGSEIEVCMNGCLVTRADVSKFRGDGDTPDRKSHPGLRNAKGRIGWCGHGYGVKWKNIRIKELPDDAKTGQSCSCRRAPRGFEACFSGCPKQLAANWKGVTTEDGFDNPIVRQSCTNAAKREVMQKIADLGMRNHWSVRDGSLFFDGFRGGCSVATRRDYADFELWADWRIMSVTGDSGLCLRGSPQVRIWDAHNQWGIGSGGLCSNRRNPSQALKVADRPVGDWNRFHVIMRGEKVTVWLNGELVVDNVTFENGWDCTRPIFPKGQVELRGHGNPIEWRNIFIRAL